MKEDDMANEEDEEETWLTLMQKAKSTAANAQSGIKQGPSLAEEIAAQYATLSSARNLISTLLKENENSNKQNNTDKQNNSSPHTQGSGIGIGIRSESWVYNMKGLQDWVHHYTKRKKLHCPNCKEDCLFACYKCGQHREYHDEL